MTPPPRPSGAAIIAALASAGVEFVVSVPDIVTSDGILWPLSRRDDMRLVRVCKEDEGVSICAALSYCDRRAVLLMQQTGLLDSLNAIRAIGKDYRLPVCMIVGLQGKEPHLRPSESASFGVRIVEPILDAMEIERHLVEEPEDCARIAPAIDRAYAASEPVCILIGRAPT
jgi:sulfopyruvate decarboxylase subunit alpha